VGITKVNTYVMHLTKEDRSVLQILRIQQTVNRPMNPSDEEIVEDVKNNHYPSWELQRVDQYEYCNGVCVEEISENYQIEV